MYTEYGRNSKKRSKNKNKGKNGIKMFKVYKVMKKRFWNSQKTLLFYKLSLMFDHWKEKSSFIAS